MKIKKFCSRCEKRIDYDKSTYYFQIFQREDKDNRDTCFLCERCLKELIKFMEKQEIRLSRKEKEILSRKEEEIRRLWLSPN